MQWRLTGGGKGSKYPPELLRGGHCPPLSILDQNVHRLIEFSRVALYQLITLSYSKVAK